MHIYACRYDIYDICVTRFGSDFKVAEVWTGIFFLRSKLAMASMWEYILRSSKIWCNLWGFQGVVLGGTWWDSSFFPNLDRPQWRLVFTTEKPWGATFAYLRDRDGRRPSFWDWKWGFMVIWKGGAAQVGRLEVEIAKRSLKLGITSGKLNLAMENPVFWWYLP